MPSLKTYLQAIAIFVLLGASLPARADTVVYRQGASNAFVSNYSGTADGFIVSGSTSGNLNYGKYGMRLAFSTQKGLLRFDLSSFAGKYSSVTSISLQLSITQIYGNVTSGTINAYAILPANAGWAQGTANGAVQAGSACWNYAKYNTQAWAGSPGLGTPDVDYNSTLLGSFAYSTTQGSDPAMAFNGSSAYLTSLVSSWTNSTNPGILIEEGNPARDGATYIWGTGDPTGTSNEQLTITYNPAYSGTDANGLNYTAVNGQITITGYSGSGGALIIPSSISVYGVDLPVTSIGSLAFSYCRSLTSVTVPNTVTSIGSYVFYSCGNLIDVTIPNGVTTIPDYAFTGCISLPRVTIPNSVTSIGNYAFGGCRGMARVTIPNSVTSIGTYAFDSCSSLTGLTISGNITTIPEDAFSNCTSLTSVTIPSNVTSINAYAFYDCFNLTSAVFLGNAPTMGSSVFLGAGITSGRTFKVYYLNGASKFTSPTWTDSANETFPSVNIGAYSPVSTWLVSYGFAYNTPLTTVPNNDGVPLLMDYALNLDPTKTQGASMPKPVVSGNQMSLTYYGGSTGVTYTVQASTDLQSWSTSGVTVSGPDANSNYTATIPISGTKEFMRLKVTY